MLILMGKSASGKDFIKKELMTKHGFDSIVTYTTRPMRKNEEADITYHYISNDEFLDRIKSNFFIEWNKYNVKGNEWYYGTGRSDVENAKEKTVIILSPSGVRKIKDNNIDTKVIYLFANLSTIQYRLRVRKDQNDKIKDRIKRDQKDFKDAELLADKIIYNDNGTNINNVTLEILEFLKMNGY